jgi:hypothetical protein
MKVFQPEGPPYIIFDRLSDIYLSITDFFQDSYPFYTIWLLS